MQISDWSVGLAGLFVCFLPFLIAALRDHKNVGPILVVNLLPATLLLIGSPLLLSSPPLLSLGSTPLASAAFAAVVAWFVALGWAYSDDVPCTEKERRTRQGPTSKKDKEGAT